MESQECYLCKTEKLLEAFIVRKDGIRYRMCRRCKSGVKAKKHKNSPWKRARKRIYGTDKLPCC